MFPNIFVVLCSFSLKQAYQRTKYLGFDQTSAESSVLNILTDRFHTAETATSCLWFSRVPDENREFVPARTLFEFSTAGLRGCVTGAIVRRSSEHPRCEFASTLLSSPFPHPGLIYFPLSLPPLSYGSRGGFPTILSVTFESQPRPRRIQFPIVGLTTQRVSSARDSIEQFGPRACLLIGSFDLAGGSRWLVHSSVDRRRWNVVPVFVNAFRPRWIVDFDATEWRNT